MALPNDQSYSHNSHGGIQVIADAAQKVNTEHTGNECGKVRSDLLFSNLQKF